MGFVAVFAGATKTPIASSVLAIEIFGIEAGIFAMLVCWVAFYASGKKSIYTS
jgi:H+/Cl- antiporter ClcA